MLGSAARTVRMTVIPIIKEAMSLGCSTANLPTFLPVFMTSLL